MGEKADSNFKRADVNVTDYILTRIIQGLPGGVSYQTKGDYSSGTNLIYFGIAKRGKATSDEAWLIIKNTYDVDDKWTAAQISKADQIWDNRSSLTYA